MADGMAVQPAGGASPTGTSSPINRGGHRQQKRATEEGGSREIEREIERGGEGRGLQILETSQLRDFRKGGRGRAG